MLFVKYYASFLILPQRPSFVQFIVGHDCGIFTCMFADFVSTNTPLLFTQHHISRCRKRIALSIMRGRTLTNINEDECCN